MNQSPESTSSTDAALEVPQSPEAIRADIEQTRADLSQAVDDLAGKLNVKAQAGAKLDDLKSTATDAFSRVKAAAPEPVAHAVDRTVETIAPAARQTLATTRPYRGKIAAGAATLIAVLFVARRRKHRAAAH